MPSHAGCIFEQVRAQRALGAGSLHPMGVTEEVMNLGMCGVAWAGYGRVYTSMHASARLGALLIV